MGVCVCVCGGGIQCLIEHDRNTTRHGSKSLGKFNMNIHSHSADTTANCKQVQNAANEADNCTKLGVTVFCRVSETRNTTGTGLSKQVSNHCSDGLQLDPPLLRWLLLRNGRGPVIPIAGCCVGNFVHGPSVHNLPSSQTSGRLASLCCHKRPQCRLIHTKAGVY